MAFRLKLDEPLGKGIRRIAAEQIEKARAQITAGQDPTREIHEARKAIKRIRALLKLARAGLGAETFRTENARFRAIGAAMAPARDESVVRATLLRLSAAADPAGAAALGRLASTLGDRPGDDPAAAGATRDDVAGLLDRALRQVRRLKIAPESFETLERGLVRNYRRGRDALDVAYAEGSDEDFHAWRKCVQVHWRHMALLSRAAPKLFEAHIAAARDLSQALGDDHDLAILKVRIAALPEGALSDADRDVIGRMIAARQQTLRQSARLSGEMIFAERPRAHGRRIAAVWKGAVALARLAEDAEAAAPERAARARAPAPTRT